MQESMDIGLHREHALGITQCKAFGHTQQHNPNSQGCDSEESSLLGHHKEAKHAAIPESFRIGPRLARAVQVMSAGPEHTTLGAVLLAEHSKESRKSEGRNTSQKYYQKANSKTGKIGISKACTPHCLTVYGRYAYTWHRQRTLPAPVRPVQKISKESGNSREHE